MLFAVDARRALLVVVVLLLHAPEALLVRGLPPRLPTVRSRHPTMCSDREGGPTEQRSPLKRFTAFADASWDLFVMPGEYANSRYDRVIPPMNASEPEPQRSAFNWGGDSKEEEALRLPTGIPAAERLAAERERVASMEGDDSDMEEGMLEDEDDFTMGELVQQHVVERAEQLKDISQKASAEAQLVELLTKVGCRGVVALKALDNLAGVLCRHALLLQQL